MLMNTRLAVWLCVVFGLGGGISRGFNPAEQSYFFASVSANGSSSTLSKIFLAPLGTQSMTTVPGVSKRIVVCRGDAYWAVNTATSTRLYRIYRSSSIGGGVQTLSTISGQSAFLETDGEVVYWCVQSPTSFVIWRISGRDEVPNYAGGISGLARFLVVDNQDAYVGSDRVAGQPQTATVHRFQIGTNLSNPLLNVPNSQIKGMQVDAGHLWTMVKTSQAGTPDSVSVRRKPVGLPSMTAEVVQTIAGEAGQLSAHNGLAVWSAKPDQQSSYRLFQCAVGESVRSFSGTGPATSGGIYLNGCFGLWWGTESGGVKALAFDPFDAEFGFSELYPDATAVDAVGLGDDIWLGLQTATESKILRFEAHANGLWPTKVIQRQGPLPALAAGAWHLFAVSETQIHVEDETGRRESRPISGFSGIQIAIGNSGSKDFFFAANLFMNRKLFTSPASGQSLLELSGSLINNPRDFFLWNDNLWLSAGEPGSRSLFSRELSSAVVGAYGQQHPDPTKIREFKGRLVFEQSGDDPQNPTGRLTIARTRDQAIEVIADGNFSSLSGATDISQGWLLFSKSSDDSALYGFDLAGAERTFWHPLPSDITPEVLTWGNWKGSLLYDYQLPNGDRLLASQRIRDGGSSAALLEATQIQRGVPTRGGFVFVATVGGNEKIFRINRPDSPATELANLTAQGFSNVRNLHAHGDFVYAVVDHGNMERVLKVGGAVFQDVPPPPGGVQRFLNFGGSLLAFTSGSNPIFRREGSSWQIIDGSPFTDANDFTEAFGSLFFSARSEEGRSLYRMTGNDYSKLASPAPETPWGFNPRRLVLHQDRLFFAANDANNARQLWEYDPVTPPQGQLQPFDSSVGLLLYLNPIEDGPQNIQISTTTLLENLPPGFLVGNLTADDEAGTEGITFQVSGGQPADQFAINGSGLLLNRPIGAWWMNQGVGILATNAVGISNRKQFSFQVIDNRLAWITDNFPNDSGDLLVTGNDRDPDGDGILNVMERALGLDPKRFYRSGERFFLPQIHFVTEETNPDVQFVELRFRSPLSIPSRVFYEVQASENLGTWNTLGVIMVNFQGEVVWTGTQDSFDMEINLAGSWREFRVRDTIPQELSTQSRFLRLKTRQLIDVLPMNLRSPDQ